MRMMRMTTEDCWNKSEDVAAAAAVADDVKVKVTGGNEMQHYWYWYWYWYWWWGRRMLNVGHSCFPGMPWDTLPTLPTLP